jgi:uncharacterized protein YycO
MKYQPREGDYGVVRSTGWAARLIQVGTVSRWNHAFIYIGDGKIVEANPTGIAISPVSKYSNIAWNQHEELTDAQRQKIVKRAKAFVGSKYGFRAILVIALKILGLKVIPTLRRAAENENSVICSQLVAWSYSVAKKKISDKPHAFTTPGDLAERLIYQ